jgi:hypothetical protein
VPFEVLPNTIIVNAAVGNELCIDPVYSLACKAKKQASHANPLTSKGFNRKYKIIVAVLCRNHVWRKRKGRNGHERRRHFLAISRREVFRPSSYDNRRFIPLLHPHQHHRSERFHRAFRFLEHRGFAYWLVPACGQATRIGYSLLSTTILQLATNATITPKAASQGATTVPITPTVAGISSSVFPFSSFTIMRVTFPSWRSPLTRSTRLLDEMVYSSLVTLAADAPQTGQNLSSSFRGAPHLVQ